MDGLFPGESRVSQVRIDPKLIIEFAAIAEERSFTRAAQRLRVAQPWLSARLHKLEDLLGFRLLNRTTRSVELTERGVDFLKAARALADASEAAGRLGLQLRRSGRRVLRVGAPPYSKIIQQRHELINGFAFSHPRACLELEISWSHALMARLHAGEIDLAFVMGDCWPGDYESVVLRRYGVALTMSRRHPLAQAASLRPEAITGKPILVFTRNLHVELWGALYAPFIALGAQLVEVPEMAEGAPSRMGSPDDIAAFIDFGLDDPGTPEVVRIPVESDVAVPFQLMRRSVEPSPDGQAFWELARSKAV